MTEHQPIVEELIALLAARPDLADALKVSIRKAERPGTATLPQYYDFLNRMVTLIPGKVTLDVIKKPDGSLDTVDGTGYQFTQDRGLIIIDSPVGLVAVLPIGMAQVSSVTLSAEVGVGLAKGEEFGYFAFGGSDIVMLFEAGKVELDAKAGTHYKQGTAIGHAAVG